MRQSGVSIIPFSGGDPGPGRTTLDRPNDTALPGRPGVRVLLGTLRSHPLHVNCFSEKDLAFAETLCVSKAKAWEMAHEFLSRRRYAVALLSESPQPDDYFEELWRPDSDPATIVPAPVNEEDHPWWLRFLEAHIFFYVFESVVRLEPNFPSLRDWVRSLPSEERGKLGVYEGPLA